MINKIKVGLWGLIACFAVYRVLKNFLNLKSAIKSESQKFKEEYETEEHYEE